MTEQPILQEHETNQDHQKYDAESNQEFQLMQNQDAQNDHVHGDVEFDQDTNKEELGVLYETSLHYLESLKYFVSFKNKFPVKMLHFKTTLRSKQIQYFIEIFIFIIFYLT